MKPQPVLRVRLLPAPTGRHAPRDAEPCLYAIASHLVTLRWGEADPRRSAARLPRPRPPRGANAAPRGPRARRPRVGRSHRGLADLLAEADLVDVIVGAGGKDDVAARVVVPGGRLAAARLVDECVDYVVERRIVR